MPNMQRATSVAMFAMARETYSALIGLSVTYLLS